MQGACSDPVLFSEPTRKSLCVSTEAIKNTSLWLAELTDVEPTVMVGGGRMDYFVILYHPWS